MIKDAKTEDIEQEKPVEEVKKVEKPVFKKKSVDVDAFIARKLKVINEWPDGAKKRSAVERLFKNKEVRNVKMR